MSFAVHKRLRESLSVIRKECYTSSHIAVLESLAYRINDKTQLCFPSVQTVADESYLSERHARKVLSQLEQDGIVEIISVNRKSNRYKLHIPNPVEALSTGETEDSTTRFQGSVAVPNDCHNASEAPLTNNLDLSSKPIKREIIHYLNSIGPSDSLQEETRSGTGDPVQPQNGKAVPDLEVLTLHAFLMKKIGSSIPSPTATDIKLLTEAIDEYGLAELYQIVEGIYRQKNKYWRVKLKQATHPCSMLCRCLGTISTQLNEKEESAVYWNKGRRT